MAWQPVEPTGHAESSARSWAHGDACLRILMRLDTVNAAVFNAEIRAPMCWPWGVRAQPDRRLGIGGNSA